MSRLALPAGVAPAPRRWRRAALLAGALVVLALAGLAWRAWRQQPPPVLAAATLVHHPPRLGEVVTVRSTLRLPWSRGPAAAPQAIGLPATWQVLRATLTRRWLPGRNDWTWDLEVALQPTALEPVKDATVQLTLTPDRAGQSAPLVLAVPPLTVLPRLPAGAEPPLVLADTPTDRRAAQRRAWLIGCGSVLLVLLGAWALLAWRRHRAAYRPPPPTAGEVANRALDALAARLPLAAEPFLVALTDIVRAYLTARFALPASARTTPEFLRDIEAPGSPLTPEQRALLGAFLTAADAVKFGKEDWAQDRLLAALEMARQLVAQTPPAPPPAA